MATCVYVKLLRRSPSFVEVQGLKNNANFTECDFFLAICSLSYTLLYTLYEKEIL